MEVILKNTIMLTGDNKGTAHKIAQLSGIKEVYAELMPEDKLSTIKDLQSKGYRVGMIGDGINDAPALAQSEVGIAMGGIGSNTAMETADVVLMSDNVHQLTDTITISNKAKNIIKQNIYFSIIIKMIAFILVFWVTNTLVSRIQRHWRSDISYTKFIALIRTKKNNLL